MTIKQLKEHLQSVLDELDDFDDESEVRVVSNTYFLRGATHILETRQGFIDLDNPVRESEDDDDE
jgi:hypothetical protein